MVLPLAKIPRHAVVLLAVLVTTTWAKEGARFRSCPLTSVADLSGLLLAPHVLSETPGVREVWGCVRRCVQHPDCRSLSHHPHRDLCVLYSHPFPSSHQASATPGFVFYILCPVVYGSNCSKAVFCTYHGAECLEERCGCTEGHVYRPSTGHCHLAIHRAPCTLSSHCPFRNMDCRDGQCSCVIGYSFHPLTGQCVPECDVYGDTFYRVANARLLEMNTYVIQSSTLARCLERCRRAAAFVCRSVEFLPATGKCHLSRATKLTHPALWEVNDKIDYYHRNCA